MTWSKDTPGVYDDGMNEHGLTVAQNQLDESIYPNVTGTYKHKYTPHAYTHILTSQYTQYIAPSTRRISHIHNTRTHTRTHTHMRTLIRYHIHSLPFFNLFSPSSLSFFLIHRPRPSMHTNIGLYVSPSSSYTDPSKAVGQRYVVAWILGSAANVAEARALLTSGDVQVGRGCSCTLLLGIYVHAHPHMIPTPQKTIHTHPHTSPHTSLSLSLYISLSLSLLPPLSPLSLRCTRCGGDKEGGRGETRGRSGSTFTY